MSSTTKTEKVPPAMQEKFNEISLLTDEFSQKYLNEEYAQMIRYTIAVLCRKRPSPLLKGAPEVWACGITYAIGAINFLFDKESQPYVSADDLCSAYNVKKSTGASKAKIVKDLLNFSQFDPSWTLPSMMDSNPVAWLIMVDGFIIDVRYAEPEIQQIAFEKGLIPYIPENKPKSMQEKRQEECQKNIKPPKPQDPRQSSLF